MTDAYIYSLKTVLEPGTMGVQGKVIHGKRYILIDFEPILHFLMNFFYKLGIMDIAMTW